MGVVFLPSVHKVPCDCKVTGGRVACAVWLWCVSMPMLCPVLLWLTLPQVLVAAPSNIAVDQLAERIAATGLRVVRLQASAGIRS